MLLKIFLFLIGVVLCASGICFMILYLNILNMGYSFGNYVNFIIRRLECWNLLFGTILIIISMIKRKDKKYDLYI